ncbi:WD repeat-containing protein DWA2, partial [Cucurbita argyrosperma subsp. sororia]
MKTHETHSGFGKKTTKITQLLEAYRRSSLFLGDSSSFVATHELPAENGSHFSSFASRLLPFTLPRSLTQTSRIEQNQEEIEVGNATGEIPTKELATLRIYHRSHGACRGETRGHKLARTIVARKQSQTARGRSRGKKERWQVTQKPRKRWRRSSLSCNHKEQRRRDTRKNKERADLLGLIDLSTPTSAESNHLVKPSTHLVDVHPLPKPDPKLEKVTSLNDHASKINCVLWWPSGRHDKLISIDEENILLWSLDCSRKLAQSFAQLSFRTKSSIIVSETEVCRKNLTSRRAFSSHRRSQQIIKISHGTNEIHSGVVICTRKELVNLRGDHYGIH